MSPIYTLTTRPQRVGGFGLIAENYLRGVALRRETPKLLHARVAVVGKMGSIPPAAGVV